MTHAAGSQPPTPDLALDSDPVRGEVIRLPIDRLGGVAVHRLGEVAVVEVHGSLGDVVDRVCEGVLHALAEEPRAVVCDLSSTRGSPPADVGESLAPLASHPRVWPGVPMVVAAPDEGLRVVLRRHAMSDHVAVRASLQDALSAVTTMPRPMLTRLRLAPHPTAGRATRLFVSRSCLDWSMPQAIAPGCLVAGELVSSVTARTRRHVDVTLAGHHGRLRIAVRVHDTRDADVGGELRGRVAVVDGFSRAWGVLPMAGAGSVVWAVVG